MDTNSQAINEAFARLSVLEFAVEIIIANQLARIPLEHSEQFKKDFVSRPANLGPAPTTSQEEQNEAWLAERIQQISARLIEKIANREKGIREG